MKNLIIELKNKNSKEHEKNKLLVITSFLLSRWKWVVDGFLSIIIIIIIIDIQEQANADLAKELSETRNQLDLAKKKIQELMHRKSE